MRLNDENAVRARMRAEADHIRAVVRTEVLTALKALRIEAERYDGGEIKDMAADAFSSLMDGTVSNLTLCWGDQGHDFTDFYGQAVENCRRCGTPDTNPFESTGD